MRTLLLGAGGMLAQEMRGSLLRAGWEVHCADRQACDITDPAAIERLVKQVAPRLIVNCAAYTQVDRAESERAAAFAINDAGAGLVAAAAARQQATLVHFSSNVVFAGDRPEPYREYDPVAPLGAYGESKWAGELAVGQSGAACYLVRTAHLYGRGGYSFFQAFLTRARQGLPLRVVDDQLVTPTWTRELAAQTLRLCQSAPPGIYHAVADGQVSWYEAARFALNQLGLSLPLQRVSTAEYGGSAPRPRNGVMSHGRLDELGLYCMRPWDVALADWLQTEHAGRAA